MKRTSTEAYTVRKKKERERKYALKEWWQKHKQTQKRRNNKFVTRDLIYFRKVFSSVTRAPFGTNQIIDVAKTVELILATKLWEGCCCFEISLDILIQPTATLLTWELCSISKGQIAASDFIIHFLHFLNWILSEISRIRTGSQTKG